MAINYQNFAGGPQQSRRLMELGAVRQQNAKNRQLNFLARMSDPKALGGPQNQFSLQGLGGGPVRFSSVFGPIRQGTDLDDQAAIMEEAQRQRAAEDARRSSGQSARLQQIRSPQFSEALLMSGRGMPTRQLVSRSSPQAILRHASQNPGAYSGAVTRKDGVFGPTVYSTRLADALVRAGAPINLAGLSRDKRKR